jgi:hypothetical protein
MPVSWRYIFGLDTILIGRYSLGVLYENGKGVAQDYDKAREWYQKAADAGNLWRAQLLTRGRRKSYSRFLSRFILPQQSGEISRGPCLLPGQVITFENPATTTENRYRIALVF